jgi:hypothetical protein
MNQVPFAKSPNQPSHEGRLLENNRPVTVVESDKPLPRDPDLRDAVRGRPVSRRQKGQRATTKSVPNIRTSNKPHHLEERRDGRGKSCADAGEGTAGVAPKAQKKSLNKTLLRPAHAKGHVSTKPENENTQSRPATAPSRPLKGRSISLEHLKALCVPRKHQETVSKSSVSPARPAATTPAATRRDNLKAQVLHYVRSDRVGEAWESTVGSSEKTRRTPTTAARRPLQKTIDWPLSIFRAKSSNTRQSRGGRDAALANNDIAGKMTWLDEDPEPLNTVFSLKPKPVRDEEPRIPIPHPSAEVTTPAESVAESVAELSLGGHDERDEGDGDGNGDGETGSLITALPSLPLSLDGSGRLDDGLGRIADGFPQPSSAN